MNTSVRLYQKASKRRADGTAPVYVRVTRDRKSSLVSTGVYVEPRYWNKDRGRVRASHDLSAALNAKLQAALTEAQQVALAAPSAAAVKSAVDGPAGSMTRVFEAYIDELRRKGDSAFWEVRKHESLLRKLRAALGHDITWSQFDRKALAKFERYMRDKSENNANTRRKELSRLRRVVSYAVEHGEISAGDDPFAHYRPPKAVPVEKRKLSMDEIQKLAGAELAEGSQAQVARDAFLLAFYGGGLRFGDVAKLKSSDISGGRLRYRMMKTSRAMDLPLPPPALAIVDKYAPLAADRGGFLFPLLKEGDDADGVRLRKRISSRNVVANKGLKRAAELAEVRSEGLSFHVARHSFADYARRESGDLYAISKSLGHSSLAVTEQYMKSLDRDAVDALASQLWS